MSKPGMLCERSPGLVKLMPYRPILDFYRTQIYIRLAV